MILYSTGSLTDAYDELGNHYVIPVYCVSTPINLIVQDETSAHSTTSAESSVDESTLGEEYMVKCRISTTCKDTKMKVRSGETVGAVKKRLDQEIDVTPSKQRWFFGGKMLHDKVTMADTRVPRGFVIQVIVMGGDT